MEEENRRLQASLANLKSGDTQSTEDNSPVRVSSRSPTRNSLSPSAETPGPSIQAFRSRLNTEVRAAAIPSPEYGGSRGSSPVVSRILISAEGEPSYHGPTSTLFDDGAGDRRLVQNVTTIPNVSPAWVQKGLMAEAAYQRK